MFACTRRGHALLLGTLLFAEPARAEEPAPPAVPLEDRVRELERMVREMRAEKANPPPPPVENASNLDYGPAVVPFAFGDFSWAPGSYSPADSPLAWGPFHGEFRVDVAYHDSLAQPKDHTISGSSEVFRSQEFQLTQLGIGGDFYYKGVHGRLLTQFGMYSETTPRNDPSGARGQWNLADAYRYISEAYAGYHINILAGINIQAGIFMSYVGLWSYYNFDNWTYQPSYVSSNTPWFFNGLRIQIFVTEKLKIEPWLINGWQAYGMFNETPGAGVQIRWSPTEWLSIVGNQYGGRDTLGLPDRQRIHTDDSIMVRLWNRPHSRGLSKAAASLTFDAGCEFGGQGTTTAGNTVDIQCGNQYFIGFMAYARAWFWRDLFGLTVGGGAITNPGRYLVLMPPINGATAFTGSPYFTENPGDPYHAWDLQTTLDFMPTRNITFRAEFTHRASDVPYFTGPGGVTPPVTAGAVNGPFVNQGPAGSAVPGWTPDLVKQEDRFTVALMIRL
jgi:hypothetical protein